MKSTEELINEQRVAERERNLMIGLGVFLIGAIIAVTGLIVVAGL